MNKQKPITGIIIAVIVGLLSVIVIGSGNNRETTDPQLAETDAGTDILYWGATCPHCHDTIEWMEENLNTNSIGVPFMYTVDGECLIGTPKITHYLQTKVLRVAQDNLETKQTKISIAVCPSGYQIADNLESEKYEIIKTNSTAESITFLKNDTVDLILSGRTLKPEEPKLDSHVIRSGYSFLGEKESTISLEELKELVIYTDQDVESIQSAFGLENIVHTNNVYNYVKDTTVVTSWQNTDYSQAALVHITDNKGERPALSRQPTLYCRSACDSQLIADITGIK